MLEVLEVLAEVCARLRTGLGVVEINALSGEELPDIDKGRELIENALRIRSDNVIVVEVDVGRAYLSQLNKLALFLENGRPDNYFRECYSEELIGICFR